MQQPVVLKPGTVEGFRASQTPFLTERGWVIYPYSEDGELSESMSMLYPGESDLFYTDHAGAIGQILPIPDLEGLNGITELGTFLDNDAALEAMKLKWTLRLVGSPWVLVPPEGRKYALTAKLIASNTAFLGVVYVAEEYYDLFKDIPGELLVQDGYVRYVSHPYLRDLIDA